VDPGSLYLNVFMGARSFKAPKLDSLADTMGATARLSSNSGDRYFVTKANVAAFSFGNKLLFGSNYYESLSEKQRLAVAAHEFGHVLGDAGQRRKRLVAPAAVVSLLLSILAFMGTGSMLALAFAAVLGFIAAAAILSSFDSEHYLRHEMSCDRLAASFVNGEALVEAIHVAESLQRASPKLMASLWKRVGAKPNESTRLRIEAILALKGPA
jgi:Zn-dependent protease with chaperone function